MPLTFFGCSDFSGLVRGRAFPTVALGRYLAQGTGWVPADQALTGFDALGEGNPFGPLGDLRLMADPATRVEVDLGGDATPLDLFLCDITEPDGRPWACCGRDFLKRAIADLAALGLTVRASFEHEFTLLDRPGAPDPGFSLRAFRGADRLMVRLMEALQQAGVEPEMILSEFGPAQFEVPVAVAPALQAADRAVVLREIVREVARREGAQASFSPKITAAGIGNGVHIHFSLYDRAGQPVGYDAAAPGQLSATAGQFAAGIVQHLPALAALTAPSAISYLRLRPHHWSAADACLGLRNREAALRICPAATPGEDAARAHHLEFRAADAAASPYLALGAVLHAGIAGLRAGLRAPTLINTDPSELSESERDRLGLRRLPASLAEALDAMTASATVARWAAPLFWQCYLSLKRTEMKSLADRDDEARCAAYRRIY